MTSPPSIHSADSSAPVKVLIIDDSAVVRQMLSRHLARDSGISVVGTAPDPFAARDMIVQLRPDVLTLDIEMPRMDGITFLHKLMAQHPMPVIVLSSMTSQGTLTAIQAMEAGAIEVLSKPTSAYSIDELGKTLVAKIKIAARARIHPKSSAPAPTTPLLSMHAPTDKILAIGASTGGVQALTELLTAFPADAPATVVVQHMPAQFTASFATRLNTMCRIEVRQARDGDTLTQGRVLIAPGGFHTIVRRSGSRYYIEINDGPELHHQKPAVDILFDSVAQSCAANAIGALLTGMGADGARGLLSMRNAGARTIAQDEESCVVFGMPMEAIKFGAAEQILPLCNIAGAMMVLAQAPARGSAVGSLLKLNPHQKPTPTSETSHENLVGR